MGTKSCAVSAKWVTWIIWPCSRCDLKSSLKYWPPTAPPTPLAYLKPSVERQQKTNKRLLLAACLLFHLFVLEYINCTPCTHILKVMQILQISQSLLYFLTTYLGFLSAKCENRRILEQQECRQMNAVLCVFCSWYHF